MLTFDNLCNHKLSNVNMNFENYVTVHVHLSLETPTE